VTVSFVVPCWNDANRLAKLLDSLAKLHPLPEIIVADASDDRAPVEELVAEAGAHYVAVRGPSRGAQLNAGAMMASGEVLVFQHADTNFSQQHLEALSAAMADRQLKGGAFYKDLRAHFPKLAWSEPLVRWYSRRIGVIYGDQSVFVRRAEFEALGGFREIPLMEDVEFSKRLRRAGQVTLIDPPLRTSMRKFEAEGAIRRKLQNLGLVWLFRLGVSPERLHRWYYRWKNPRPSPD